MKSIIEAQHIPEKIRVKLRKDFIENRRMAAEAVMDDDRFSYFWGRGFADQVILEGSDPANEARVLRMAAGKYPAGYVRGFLEVCGYFEGIV